MMGGNQLKSPTISGALAPRKNRVLKQPIVQPHVVDISDYDPVSSNLKLLKELTTSIEPGKRLPPSSTILSRRLVHS